MINSYTSTTQNVGVNIPLIFNTNKIKTGCTVTHSEGSSTFSLNKPGFYFVTLKAIGSTTATTGNLTIQMYQNGVAVVDAISTESSTATTDISTLNFATIVQVKPSCCAVDNQTSLTFVNTGVAATYTNVSVTITKLC